MSESVKVRESSITCFMGITRGQNLYKIKKNETGKGGIYSRIETISTTRSNLHILFFSILRINMYAFLGLIFSPSPTQCHGRTQLPDRMGWAGCPKAGVTCARYHHCFPLTGQVGGWLCDLLLQQLQQGKREGGALFEGTL